MNLPSIITHPVVQILLYVDELGNEFTGKDTVQAQRVASRTRRRPF